MWRLRPGSAWGGLTKRLLVCPNPGWQLPGAALTTFLDRPREAGPHGRLRRTLWCRSFHQCGQQRDGGQFGAAWGEDPRYARAGAEVSFKSRLAHVAKWTVLAPNRDGDLRPAYARFIAFSSSSFISNGWREPSDTTHGSLGDSYRSRFPRPDGKQCLRRVLAGYEAQTFPPRHQRLIYQSPATRLSLRAPASSISIT